MGIRMRVYCRNLSNRRRRRPSSSSHPSILLANARTSNRDRGLTHIARSFDSASVEISEELGWEDGASGAQRCVQCIDIQM